MRWFRFYTDVLDNPKVQRLSDRRFKQWVNLLCLANQGKRRGRLPADVADIAFSLRESEEEITQALEEFQSGDRPLLDRCEETGRLMPHDWDELQPPSDDSTARVQRHRQRQSNGDRNGDVTVTETPPEEEENRLDTETDEEVQDAALEARGSAAESMPDEEIREDELELVKLLKQTRGMAMLPDLDVARHLREVQGARASPLTQRALRFECMKFRDHWTEKRLNQPKDKRWRAWRKALTEWLKRATETRNGRIVADEPFDVERNLTGPYAAVFQRS
jgi:hypothetical protein